MFPKIIFNSPWYALLLCLVAGIAVSAWLYYRNKKNSDCPPRLLRLLAFLRFLSFSTIALLLLELLLKQSKHETEDPIILVAVDNSRSMVSGADSANVRAALSLSLDAIKEELGEHYLVRTLHFGAEAKASSGAPDFSEKETDIENLLKTVENNYANQNIGALIIASDGIYNRGANPMNGAARLGYPFYTIAFGDTTEKKDARIKKIDHNQLAYLGNAFPVEVLVSAKKLSGREAKLEIFHSGILRSSQTVKFNSDNFLAPLQFTLNAESRGVQRYDLRLSRPDGDSNPGNNAVSFIIEVIDNKDKILLLASSPHPDISAIREVVLAGSSYDAEFGYTQDFRKPLKQYSLVIFHGFNSSHSAFLDECRSGNIPYWIINPYSPDHIPGMRINGNMGRYNDAEAYYERSFGLFSLSDQLSKFIRSLPAVKTFFGNYTVSNGIQSLMKQRVGAVETGQPLFAFSDNDGSKSALFAGDGLWKWKMRDYAEHGNHELFSELIGKTLQYLVVKGDKSFFRVTAPKIANENEQVELQAEVYDKSYVLTTAPDVFLTLSNPKQKKFSYTFGKTMRDYRLNLGLLPAGDYDYQAKVNINGELLVKQGRITVREIVAEQANTLANHQLLFQLANRSGGRMFSSSDLGKLPGTLLKDEQLKPVTYTTVSTNPVIELRWLFAVILISLSVEWYFRKRYLTI